MAFDFSLTPEAVKDFHEIYSFLKENAFTENVNEKLSDKFEKALERVCRFPDACPAYKGYRKLVVDKYLIFYKVNEKKNLIIVYRAIHSMMNYNEFL